MPGGFIAVIPARYGSTRLPGKPLADINGKTMIQRVYERTIGSEAAEVMVATDDERIMRACAGFGARAELTRGDHRSGTDRIAELAERFAWPDAQIVVNVQGDEPGLPPALVTQVAAVLETNCEAGMATLAAPLICDAQWHDPNVAKVVTDRDGRALYFSRASIPFPQRGERPRASRHVGIYAYRVRTLKALAKTPPCELELIEGLEQLRALWLGFQIVVAQACEAPSRHVETREDLEAVRRELAARRETQNSV